MNTTAPPHADARESGRDRLLAAANELFYAEGIQSVGIDRIIEHAGVAKATLYNNFASKEELVQAYLLSRDERTMGRLSQAIAAVDDPRQKLLAPFEFQADQFSQPGFNGCAFASAATEPSGGLVDQAVIDFRGRVLAMFTDLATQAAAPDPQSLGRQLHVLYDGAALTSRMDHDPDIAAATRSAAEAIIDRALA
jgi:AcrR family transcriptional regulator